TLGMETATLNIITTPDNAAIYIDGERAGTGYASKAVSIGAEHRYKVECDDYITEESAVTFTQSEKKELNIELRPDFGYITVKSTPSGAEVYIDEKKAGATPYQMKKIKRGQHVVELRMAGYEPFADMVTIKAGEVNKQFENVVLEAVRVQYGKVYVVSSPSGADITIDNDYKGKTPMTVDNVPVGSRNVTLTYGDYAPAMKTVMVEEGKTASVNVTLTNGRNVEISTDKPGDQLYADGNYLGASPLTATLSFGTHNIKAVRDSKAVEKTITVAQTGGDSSVELEFFGNKTFTVNGVTFEMVAVKGGTFTMGATSEQGSDAYDSEKPTHSVTLGDYYIGKFEVTQELWEAVMGSNPSYFKGSKLPVESVSWNDCQTFIRKLNSLTGVNFRLPTEAEWEYAARGGSRSRGYKYSGSNSISDVAWYDDNSGSKIHTVGTKSPNELGIYDMSGNVWEWCQDWKGSYSSGSQNNPTGALLGSDRVYRGGGWRNGARNCRVSHRYCDAPSSRYYGLGFRLVLVP
ncbi:MAG: SUMF1/EgtB/PvdO family nonheme iron enzyme, partial [bacterium]|nr:SUMF1/EgtB/PvdO family nonheme iron enzyme [Candidatus Limimorpha caballi]